MSTVFEIALPAVNVFNILAAVRQNTTIQKVVSVCHSYFEYTLKKKYLLKYLIDFLANLLQIIFDKLCQNLSLQEHIIQPIDLTTKK